MIRILALAALFASSISFADQRSAYREPGRSYLTYKHEAQFFSVGPRRSPRLITPMDLARKGVNVKALPAATEWETEAVMKARFNRFRDERFLTSDTKPDFARRSSWLYPDDGCFARAALAIRNLSHWSYPVPKKVFAFGDLTVNTPNAIDGAVTWWYHVAPLVEVKGQKYVLDPAIEPHRPLKLEEWLAAMNSDPSSIEVQICESGTYSPGDDCAKVTDGQEDYAIADQKNFLDQEWQRLLDLKREPDQELGEHPP